eukprot:6190308-Pleurochrysis_carterae.AAC.4
MHGARGGSRAFRISDIAHISSARYFPGTDVARDYEAARGSRARARRSARSSSGIFTLILRPRAPGLCAAAPLPRCPLPCETSTHVRSSPRASLTWAICTSHAASPHDQNYSSIFAESTGIDSQAQSSSAAASLAALALDRHYRHSLPAADF